MRRIAAGIATVVAVGGLGAGYYYGGSGSSPYSEKPQVWVSTTGSDTTCKRGSQTLPCLTPAKACSIAQGGDTVEMQAGSYGSVELDSTGGSFACNPSSMVTFRPVPGASVTMTNLQVGDGANTRHGSSNLTFKNITVSGAVTGWGFSSNLWFINVNGREASSFGVNGFHVIGGTWGNCQVPADSGCGNFKFDQDENYTPTQNSQNVYVIGATIHDIVSTNSASFHLECMFLRSVNVAVIEGNRFYDCHFYDIFIQHNSNTGTGATNVTIQNNWFDSPYASETSGSPPPDTPRRNSAISFGDSTFGWTNFLIRFNSFHNSTVIENENGTSQAYTNVRILANLGLSTCAAYTGVTDDYNVYSGATGCGTNKQTSVAEPYVSATTGSTGNYHLANSSVNGYVTPSTTDYQLDRDRDGDARTLGNTAPGADAHS